MNFDALASIKNVEALKKFTDEAIDNAINNTEHEEIIGMEHACPHKGFIDSNTRISNVDSDWVISDNNYAYYFVNGLRERGIKNIPDALNKVHSFINAYFGIYTKPEIREQIVMSAPAGKTIDVSTLAGKNTAICVERTALVQNLVTMLGVESYFITGNIQDKDGFCPHAYNIIRFNDQFYLYDVSKEVAVNVNGNVMYQPYVKPISTEQVETLFSAKQINTGDRIYDSTAKYNGIIVGNGQKTR